MSQLKNLPKYDTARTYDWNYEHAPDPVEIDVPDVRGNWRFCGLPVDSPLGVPAGPLLNGRWCLYYASLGFDVVTYKTVRSRERSCYELPNLQPVDCGQLDGSESSVPAAPQMRGSWAVSFGMPSKAPDIWRADVENTREKLPKGKLLSVSVVGTVQEGWTLDDLADDYAQCARWARESGADVVETNFSCPNVSTRDGQIFQQPQAAALVTEKVRAAIGETPYAIKIGHVPTREEAAALVAAVAPHVDALAMTNSVATTVVASDGTKQFDGESRGICGAGILAASIAQTRMISDLIHDERTSLQLIGVGGASKFEDVRHYVAAGAHAVHIASAAMVNPRVGLEIRRELARTDEAHEQA